MLCLVRYFRYMFKSNLSFITLHEEIKQEGKQRITYFLDAEQASVPFTRKLKDTISDQSGFISYRYDPDNPVPTCGGNLLTDFDGKQRFCSVLQEEPGYRDDVITYITPPLTEDMHICGSIKVRLFVSSDADDTAFMVKVMKISEDGKSYNISDSASTLSYRDSGEEALYTPGEIIPAEIALTDIIWLVKKGFRLRLDISSSNFPAFHIHSNYAGPWAEQTRKKPAQQQIHMGKKTASCIEIPIIE